MNEIKNKMESYEDTMAKLENVKNIKKDLTINEIIKFFENLFGIKFSESLLIDISMEENKFNRIGRPKLNKGNKQMRHVIPISFIDNMIQSYIINKEDYKDLLNALAENIQLFIYENEGICLHEKDYNKIKNIDNNIKYNYKLRNKINNEHIYIIEPGNVYLFKKYMLINEEHKRLYKEKKTNFIKYVIKQITKEIENMHAVKNITNLFVIFIYILFNTRENISFPEEGNTLNYKIRLEEINNKNYQIVSNLYIEKNIDNLKYNDNIKIRIVNNEGSVVRTTNLALNCLNDILGNSITGLIDDKTMKNYNKKYNNDIFIDNNNLEIFNKCLNLENLDNIKYHIAKHLYFVFDYKKLEDKVFIKVNDKYFYDNNLCLKVYENAKSEINCDYTLLDGEYYREQSIINAKNNKKYVKNVIFRKNVTDISDDEYEKDIVSNHIINIVWLISMTYPYFIDINNKIIFEFSKLITMNYNINHDLFYTKYIKSKIDKIDIFNPKDNNSINTNYSYNIEYYLNN